jgi:hypothetical protein
VQDQYVCDIGDYGKYGLLRALFGNRSSLRLGVVWYRVPNESHKTDGKYTGYLSQDSFRACDPELFDQLKILVDSGKRTCQEIERSSVFKQGTKFYSQLLLDNQGIMNQRAMQTRRDFRKEWLKEALELTESCDAVFLDPDNGLEVASVPKGCKASCKYVYLDEISLFVNRRQTTIVYHHLCRNGSHDEQIKKRQDQLRRYLQHQRELWALRFRAYSSRVYFLIPNDEHKDAIRKKLGTFIDSPWMNCFEGMPR